LRSKSRRSLNFYLLSGLWVVLLAGCGYRSVYGHPGSERLSVQVGQVLIPEPMAAQAAASGARSEFAAAGLLASGAQFPRLVLDVLRVDELSRGIHVQDGRPRAAGMSIAVTVRGRIFQGENQDPRLDTGDLRRSVQVSGDSDPRSDSAAFDAALRSAAEQAGRAAARAALGIPEPNDTPP